LDSNKRYSVIIITGVSGCGKTTIGKHLAKALDCPFYDADDFHPQANIDKMASGKPLNDDDRKPWLEHLATKIKDWSTIGISVLACSALKESYREQLAIKNNTIEWVFLEGNFKIIKDRMEARSNHFFKPNLLLSQFETLEAPKQAISVSVEKKPQEIVGIILKALKENE